MVGPQQISFGEVALLFICQERSSFHSYQKPIVLLFPLLLLVFVFSLICIQIFLYLFIKVYFCLWTMLVFLKRVGLKKFEWCWKREKKSFMQKSGTRRSLCRLRFRFFHVMLDIFLIVWLVVFAIAWLISNNWDCLMSLWKKSCVVLNYLEALFWFSPWCSIWVDLAHAHTC
jgi:hypothetical protein